LPRRSSTAKPEREEEQLFDPTEIDIFKSKLFFLAGCGDIVIGLIFYLMTNVGNLDGSFFITAAFLLLYLAANAVPFVYYLVAFSNYGRYFAILASAVVPVYFLACLIVLSKKGEVPEIYAIGFYVVLFLHYLAVRADLLWLRVRHPEQWSSVRLGSR